MIALALHHDDDAAIRRWMLSALIVAACHAAAVGAGLFYARISTPGAPTPVITIDLAPSVSAAPTAQQSDVAPGPQMQQADAPPESSQRTVREASPETIAPTPLQENPEVVAPAESRPAPEAARASPAETGRVTPKPTPPKPVTSTTRGRSDSKPAPRTTAAPKAERQATNFSGAMSGASSAAAVASYNQIVAAHLQRFKQYPAASRSAGEQGVARLSFTLGRNGQVLGSHLAGSSGYASLDNEALAMVRRAQPFPAMPADINKSAMSFVVPVRFANR